MTNHQQQLLTSTVRVDDSLTLRPHLVSSLEHGDPMPAVFYLKCLGVPELHGSDGKPIRMRVRKHFGLLIYLAMEYDRVHRRERLADFFWPRADQTQGRHSLATALSEIRRIFGQVAIDADRDHVRFKPERLTIDVDALIGGKILGDETTPPIEVDGFLAGFELADAPEFMHWRERRHADLLPAIHAGLLIGIDHCRRTGDSRLIARYADRLLAIDDIAEEGIRAKMEAFAFAGERLLALKVFEEWKERLEVELAATPSQLLEGMAIRLRRRGLERTTTIDIPSVPMEQWKGRVFVGRSEEYRILYEAWESAQRAHACHVLIMGDSGVGKTTLVERLATAAGLQGASESRVQCYELERDIPYAALAGLILGLLDRPGVSATAPEALAGLGRIVPKVRERFPQLPRAAEVHGESARLHLAESTWELFTAVMDEHPLVLIIDDYHLADEASLAVLHHLLRRMQDRQVMVLLTARPVEFAEESGAARIRDAGDYLRLRRLDLKPLSSEDSAELLRHLLLPGEAPTAQERRALLTAAGGFPMVLELLVEDWRRHGTASLALSINAMTPELAREAALEGAYRRVVNRITRDLDSGTQMVLHLATILGSQLNNLEMYSIVDLTRGQVVTGLSELTRRRILRDSGRGLEFANELLRAEVYVELTPTVRRHLHGAIADRLLSAYASGVHVPGLEIAWHCTRANRTSEAAPHLLRGAREAVREGAPHEAERALVTGLPSLPAESNAEGRLALAEVYQGSDRFNESLEMINSIVNTQTKAQTELLAVLKMRAVACTATLSEVERTELSDLARGSRCRNRGTERQSSRHPNADSFGGPL